MPRQKKIPPQPLSPDRIEETALALIEDAGLAAFSLRALAARLNCQAMSLYHYYPSKEHLIDALVDRLIGRLTVLSRGLAPWRRHAERSAREWRALALDHPNFFALLAQHRLNTPAALRWLDGALAFFTGLGLSAEDGTRIFRAFGYYLSGAGLDETAGYSRGPGTVAPLPAEILERDFPSVAAAAPFFRPDGFEKTFELGLRIILDGIDAMIAKRRR
jgi:AcrR family transcriptional regulator